MTRSATSTKPNTVQAMHTHLAQDDIDAVERVLHTYAWALDTKDWSRLRNCFSNDVDFRASNFGIFKGVDALVDVLQKRTARVPVRRHMFTNIFVSIDGDRARATSYLILLRERLNVEGGANYLATGFYSIDMIRTPKGWRMSTFRYEGTTSEGNSKLDPDIGPIPYQRVMASLSDAAWDAPNESVGCRSATQSVRDLLNAFVRAIDASDWKYAKSLLSSNASLRSIEGRLHGAEAIASFLEANSAGQKLTILTNVKPAVVHNKARIGSYVFRFFRGDGKLPEQDGGLLYAEAECVNGTWQLSAIDYMIIWSRHQESTNDPVELLGLSEYPKKLWEWEDERESEKDEKEIFAALVKYTWANDIRVPDLIKNGVAEDVDGLFVLAKQFSISGADNLTQFVADGRKSLFLSFHGTMNPLVAIDISGKTADLKAYCFTRRTHNEEGKVLLAGGHYEGHLQKQGNSWVFNFIKYQRAFGPFL